MNNDMYPGDFSLNGNFASAEFGDAEDTRPTAAYMEAFGGHDSVNGIVSQALSRHVSESIPASSSPLLTSFATNMNNWRKKPGLLDRIRNWRLFKKEGNVRSLLLELEALGDDR
jgi:hypothetical protein